MKYLRTLLFLSLLLLLAGTMGCSSFRALFSRGKSPHKNAPERRSSHRRNERSEDRDPIYDMFKVKTQPKYMHDKNLTARERELLQEQLDSGDLSQHRKRIRSDYESEQKKRQDWVFSR